VGGGARTGVGATVQGGERQIAVVVGVCVVVAVSVVSVFNVGVVMPSPPLSPLLPVAALGAPTALSLPTPVLPKLSASQAEERRVAPIMNGGNM
jgi:hypothetical protein